ncbi:MAG: hypothetical protein K6E67_09825 [Prevotella sp.]|nr:hypothetical protein [Prevotella sp.]
MKKRNEDAPENLGGLGGMLPAEVLKLLNELLERMHQEEGNKHGSKIEIVYVASGGQHVETQINIGPHPGPPCVGREKSTGELPDVLSTPTALALWKKAQAAGWIDANYQPLISRTQAALLADAMAERLSIREKWKVFETLWNRTKMYKDYYQAVDQKQYLPFLNKLKQTLD